METVSENGNHISETEYLIYHELTILIIFSFLFFINIFILFFDRLYSLRIKRIKPLEEDSSVDSMVYRGKKTHLV